jgi:branched-chain amino acid aminotransferase
MAVYHVDGALVESDRTPLLTDRGLWFGDAATETLRAFGGTLFAWDAHESRLHAACEGLGIDPPDDLRSRVRETLSANGLREAAVRVSVTRGAGAWALTPWVEDPADGGGAGDPADGEDDADGSTTDPGAVAAVAVRPMPRGGSAGTPPWDGPAALQTVKTRATPARSVPDAARTHNRLDAVLARRELVADADDALLLDADGDVRGGATADLCFVADGAVRAPARDAPTVARDVVLDLAESERFPVRTGAAAPDDVRSADEAFLVAPTLGVRPVGTVDGIAVGSGPLTRLLSRLYDARVDDACYAGDGTDGAAGADGADDPGENGGADAADGTGEGADGPD